MKLHVSRVNLHESIVSLHSSRLYIMTWIRIRLISLKNTPGWTFLALYLEEKVWRGEHELGLQFSQLFLLLLPRTCLVPPSPFLLPFQLTNRVPVRKSRLSKGLYIK
jgi:hypothetical protein